MNGITICLTPEIGLVDANIRDLGKIRFRVPERFEFLVGEMSLEILPTRAADAAENMAVDFLLLQRYPREAVSRFRHYTWRNPAFTFGYSQKIAAVRASLPAGETFDLCRRPTGGGLVDHQDDWTYAIVIPRGQALEDLRATQSYREVHECLAGALQRQGVPAVTKSVPTMASPPSAPTGGKSSPRDPTIAAGFPEVGPGVCFERAELFDVVHSATGEKIAGAAQKRNKRGLLFQGSLWRPALGQTLDEDQLLEDFVAALAAVLNVTATPVPWPDFNDDEVSGLAEDYRSTEWIESR